MYWYYPCPACGKIFYTFNDNQTAASNTLYSGIEKHIADYREQNKDMVLDHPDKSYQDVNTIYYGMQSSESIPSGGYEVE